MIPISQPSCICTPTSTPYLSYMNETTAKYGVDCEPYPRGEMAMQHNPACKMETYHGGLQCCHHTWFLTDLEQNDLIPDAIDEYYLKFRYYYQEYTPATKT